jgi:hypothetical protein
MNAITVNSSGLFVAVGYISTSAVYATSSDGSTWTTPAYMGGSAATGLMISVTVNSSGKFVAVGYGVSTRPVYATSTNGSTWTTPAYMNGSTTAANMKSVTVNSSGLFVAVGYSSASVYATSTDGSTWTTPASMGGSTTVTSMNAITVNSSGLFVAVGYSGNALGGNPIYATSTSNWKLLETPVNVAGAVSTSVTLSSLTKGTGSVLTNAIAGTDYVAPNVATLFTKPQRASLSTETAPSSGTVTWDLTSDQVFRINLNSNITTFSVTGTLSSLIGYQYQVIVRYNGGTSIAWNNNMKWPSGASPMLTGISNKVDVLTFIVTSIDGTNYYLVNTGINQNVG